MKLSQIKRLYRRFDARTIKFKTINLVEAIDLFRAISPKKTCWILTRTEPREIRKMGNPYGWNCCVVKRREVIIKQNYERAVNEQRKKERKKPNFEAKGRIWGDRIDLPFVIHYSKDGDWKIYISVHVVKNLGVEYFTLDMKPIPLEELKPYFKKRSTKTRQGLKKAIQYRDYELTNILAFTLIDEDTGEERAYMVDVEAFYKEEKTKPRISPARKEAENAGKAKRRR